jgi:hypothetical protein
MSYVRASEAAVWLGLLVSLHFPEEMANRQVFFRENTKGFAFHFIEKEDNLGKLLRSYYENLFSSFDQPNNVPYKARIHISLVTLNR